MEVRITHPVYPSDGSSERFSELEQSVAPLMAMSEEDPVALVPDRTGFRYVACPSCEEGTHESQLTWTVDDPHRVTCRFCGTIHPGEAYPEDETVEVTNPLGARVSYPCCVDDSGRRYFFSARAWWYARFYLAERARDLGRFYQMTGDARYARRSTLILHTFACHYPGYLVCLDEVHRPKAFHNKPPFPRRGGKWGEWRYQEIPTDLVFAYDSVFESGELERLSEESGSDVRRTVEEGFFRGALRQDDYHGPLYTNASPATYEGYAVLGRVLGDPSLVHEAVRRSRGLFERH